MAFIPAPLIPGVTLTAIYQNFAVTAPYPPSGTAATLGVDYSVNGTTGEITILRSFSGLGGWMTFLLHDTGGVIAATPEYPAIAGRYTADFTALAGGISYDWAYRLSSSGSHSNFLAGGSSHVQTSGVVYDGSHFEISAGSDGAFSSGNVQGATLLLELDLTLTTPTVWGGFVECFEDSE